MFESTLVDIARRHGLHPVTHYSGELESRVEPVERRTVGTPGLFRRMCELDTYMHPSLHVASRLFCAFVLRKQAETSEDMAAHKRRRSGSHQNDIDA